MVVIFLLSLTFTASVDRTTVGVGESFIVSVSIMGESVSGIDEPRPPDMDIVDIIGRSSSHSTQVQFINGKFTKSTSLDYEYTMIAKEKGDYTIPPFTLAFEGREYKTDPIKITIAEESSQPVRVTEGGEKRKIPSEDMSLECSISREFVYPGEGVIVTYELFTRSDIADVRPPEFPAYRNVWVENIMMAKRLDFKKTVRNGVSFYNAVLKKDLIFPLEEGEVKIEPMEMLVMKRGDIFSLFNEGRWRALSTEPKTIRVKSLPAGGPSVFKDAVGNFDMDAEMDTSNIYMGEPFPLSIKVSGSGNLLFMSPPEIPEMRRFNIFTPESKEDTRVEGSTIGGMRTFTYLLTPKESGVLEIPAIEWAFFNPEKGKYIKESVGPFSIRVNPEKRSATSSEVRGEDIAFLMKINEDSIRLLPRFFFLWFLFPLILISISGYYVWERKRLLGDRDYARIKAIPSALQKGFKRLKKEAEDEEMERFYREISHLILKFLKLRFSVNAFSLRKDELLDILREKEVNDDYIADIDRLIERSEGVRFAAKLFSKDEMMEDLDKLKRLIRDLH